MVRRAKPPLRRAKPPLRRADMAALSVVLTRSELRRSKLRASAFSSLTDPSLAESQVPVVVTKSTRPM